ncbi:DUF2269 family protein [Rhizobium sp. SG570]|uniref:DUF2269 family protein n=1 Tax=Rhizobium sp. SG570 TaxID=2587113 RepID=UPI001447759B|nr:DUF2269 family protein [Rhizobium sp. SG570]
MLEEFLRLAHVVGATVLFGTGAGIAFFMVMAHRTGDPYHRLYRVWFACGFPAFFSVVGIFWLMLNKPSIALF